MSAPDFKTLLEACPRNGAYSLDAHRALLEYQERTNPAVMRVVWEALNLSQHGLESPREKTERLAAVRHALSLLNGTTPTDKKEE